MPPAEAVVVLASDTTAYRTLTDLKGLPVGATNGSIQLALLQRTGGFSEIKAYDTEEDAWGALSSGAVKAAVTAGSTTMYAAKHGQLANLRIVGSYQSSSPRPQVGIAVKKGNNELLEKTNSSLARLEADGTAKAIFSKYGLDDWTLPKWRCRHAARKSGNGRFPQAAGKGRRALVDSLPSFAVPDSEHSHDAATGAGSITSSAT